MQTKSWSILYELISQTATIHPYKSIPLKVRETAILMVLTLISLPLDDY